MPKSKRERTVSLTRTEKKGRQLKNDLIEKIRECIDTFETMYMFTFENLRSTHMSDIRKRFVEGRVFLGKNKLMQVALGQSESEAHAHQTDLVAAELQGQCGLLFSNEPEAEVVQWFRNYSVQDFARAGSVAARDIFLPVGPLVGFQHTMEPMLRTKLGLPVKLVRGIIELVEDVQLCKAGEPLSAEQAQVAKLLGEQMATFKPELCCRRNSNGEFIKY